MRKTSSPLLLLTLALLVGLSALACGIFDEDAADVTFDEDFSVPVPINAGLLCPGDCSTTPVQTQQDRELKPLDVGVDVDIVALTGSSKLGEYSGKLKRVSVTSIEYSVTGNSLSMDIPPMTLYIGPTGANDPNASGVLEIGTIPTTAPGVNVPKGQGVLNVTNVNGVSDLLKSLRASVVVGAQPVVKKGQNFPPSGEADVKITLFIEVVANPIDALTN